MFHPSAPKSGVVQLLAKLPHIEHECAWLSSHTTHPAGQGFTITIKFLNPQAVLSAVYDKDEVNIMFTEGVLCLTVTVINSLISLY